MGLVVEKESGTAEGTTEVTFAYRLGEFQRGQVEQLREALFRRRQDLGWSSSFASQRVGRRGDFVRRLELAHRNDQKLSTLQDWCRAVDLRLRLWVPSFGPSMWPLAQGRFAAENRMLWQYWDLSTMDGDKLIPDLSQRLWVVALLRACRRHLRLDAQANAAMLRELGMNAKGFWKWEAEATDPMLGRCMRYAEVLGVRLRVAADDAAPDSDELLVGGFEQWSAPRRVGT